MFDSLKESIKENKKLFTGLALMVISFAIIITITLMDKVLAPVEGDESASTSVSKTTSSSTSVGMPSLSMPNFGVSEKSSTDFLSILLFLVFLIGIFLIMSKEKKK